MDKNLLDHIDSCMQMLGISLNVAEHGMNYDLPNTEEVNEAVRHDYRRLSDAILSLRGQCDDKETTETARTMEDKAFS
jgi:hypothetical protein